MVKKITLTDQADYEAPGLDIEIKEFNGAILIKADGHGEMCSEDEDSHPIVIELYQGTLRVLAWADINQEDCTHIIDMSGAKSENRVDTH